MRLGKYLSSLTKPELDYLRDQLNLSDNEIKIFELLAKDKCIVDVALSVGCSTNTVDRNIRSIKNKCIRLQKGCGK